MSFTHYVLKTGKIKENSCFHTSVIKRINENKDPVWGFSSHNKSNMIKTINSTENNLIWLQPGGYKKPIAVLIVDKIRPRVLGPLVELDEDNECLGWDDKEYHYVIDYTKFFWLENTDVEFIEVKGQTTFRTIRDSRDIGILENEIKNIIKYCNIKVIR